MLFSSAAATVRPWLLLGASAHEQDYAMLKERGVQAILQIGSELRPSYEDRFTYLRIALDDAEAVDLVTDAFPRCFAFLEQLRSRLGPGEPLPVVLVHCAAGMSRSAALVVAYLMWAERLPYDVAFKQVKASRPCIYPNLGFLLQLWEWESLGCPCASLTRPGTDEQLQQDQQSPPQQWPGWNKARYAARLAEYRRAQAAAGVHPNVRVRVPMTFGPLDDVISDEDMGQQSVGETVALDSAHVQFTSSRHQHSAAAAPTAVPQAAAAAATTTAAAAATPLGKRTASPVSAAAAPPGPRPRAPAVMGAVAITPARRARAPLTNASPVQHVAPAVRPAPVQHVAAAVSPAHHVAAAVSPAQHVAAAVTPLQDAQQAASPVPALAALLPTAAHTPIAAQHTQPHIPLLGTPATGLSAGNYAFATGGSNSRRSSAGGLPASLERPSPLTLVKC